MADKPGFPIGEKPIFFVEKPGFGKKLSFSAKKLGFWILPGFFDQKTQFFFEKPGLSPKNRVSRLKNRVSWQKNPVFQIWLINLVFRLARNTINDNDMFSYSLTTMMCFLTKEWHGFSAHTVNLFIKAYQKITYKEDLKITLKRCVLEMICFSLWFWLWCAFYNS